jgi:CBS domain containing-hemolysin-like protein
MITREHSRRVSRPNPGRVRPGKAVADPGHGNNLEIAGSLPLHELEELVGETLQIEGITSVSGVGYHRLGGFAKPGDVVLAGAFQLRVEEMEGMRVARLRLCRISEKQDDVQTHGPSI